uniref:DYW domain-containing protein n=1 Tax=Nelumbo nucifera TaxID=4432 RepID=A0A822YF96_NELNU|nr:TPA_asm: hypothetical protein HUJ06_031619 [Nelumbo nucifera]
MSTLPILFPTPPALPFRGLPLPRTQIKSPKSDNCFKVSLKNLKSSAQLPTLHSHLLKTGLLSDIYTANTLIHRYSESGCISQAEQLFNEMPQRNLVSWTSLISGYTRSGKSCEALRIFTDMLDSGFCPNEFAFGSALRACAESGYVSFGKQLHGLIVKTGFAQNEFVDSGLIVMYSKSGNLDTANGILVRMQEKDAFSWTAMVVGYTNRGYCFQAITLFVRMVEENVWPSEYTFTSVLKACSSSESIEEGVQVHCYAIKTGFEQDLSVRVSLVDLYTKVGDLPSAQLIYDRSPVLDVILCTAMIGGFAHNKRPELAIELFLQMLEEFEIVPNEFTFVNVISACVGIHEPRLGACLHALLTKTGHRRVVQVEGALIDMYAKNGDITSACRVYDNMVEKDAMSCSSILAGLSSNGRDQEALKFYSTLHQSHLKPDPFALASVTELCAKLADQIRGRQIHAQVIKHGHENDTCIASALMDMYSKSGTIEDAQFVFDNLSQRDRIAWTAMIDGYAEHGQGLKALESFERMKEEGIIPNEVTYVSILYACSHAGLVAEGLHYFHLMSLDHGIEPVIHHYACMVDLLGRAGRLEDALGFINSMPIEPSALVWRAFLGACRLHRNLKMGIHASERLLELDPDDDSAYVLLANMYAEAGQWTESHRVRKLMSMRGVTKVPGLSWIEVKNCFHVFGAGDSIHPQKELIYRTLDDLNPEMKAAGYVPKIGSSTLQDVDGEEDRLACYHSEKLAVAFGLMSTPNGFPIRIFKNLRVCGDCHSAIKIISLIRNRAITVRDTSRFHHFRDGKCSCGDYW